MLVYELATSQLEQKTTKLTDLKTIVCIKRAKWHKMIYAQRPSVVSRTNRRNPFSQYHPD